MKPIKFLFPGICALLLFSVSAINAHAAEDFSIVLLPDTQNYAEKPSYGVYRHQTQWIVNQKQARNIQFVAHLGDITQHDVVEQWQVADQAHALLDNAQIPFSMTPGNHDFYPSKAIHARQSMFVNYFGPQRYAGKSWYGGAFNSTNENNYMYFSAKGMDFLVVSLEFAPRKDVVTWANKVIQQHPNHRVIVATHCYQNSYGDHTTGWADHYNVEGREGIDLWEELLQRHSNIFLMVSGHIQGTSYNKRVGQNGNVVHEILTDFQSEPVLGNGTALGNGWLRVLTFKPDENKISVETLSVEAGNTSIFSGGRPQFYLNYNRISNPTADRHNQMNFDLSYDMQSIPGYSYSIGDPQYKDRKTHTSLQGNHVRPQIVSLENGNSIVVWQDDRDNNGYYQIHARAFDSDGNALFNDITVNSAAGGQQLSPSVASDESGNFVVVWEDDQDNNGNYQIYVRGFHANGSERFSDMAVSGISAGQQRAPAVAMDASGNFVVAWQDDRDGNGYFQIKAKGFSPEGGQRFSDRTVNSVAAGQQYNPAVAMGEDGEFVVVWEDDQENDDNFTILGRGFNPSGTERISDFSVNSVTTGDQSAPDIAMDSFGRFIVVWEDDKDGNGYYQIYARAFNADGRERLHDFTVNSTADGQQRAPGVGVDAVGNFVIAFEDDNDENDYNQIYARSFNSSGSQHKADFTVNSDGTGHQYRPAVDLKGSNITVTWEDDMDGDGGYAVLMRNFPWQEGGMAKVATDSEPLSNYTVSDQQDVLTGKELIPVYPASPGGDYKNPSWQ
ncbi:MULTISPECIES: metallophosphoesterase [unclassified Microbulbifer]|uniref:metallophosphoesterase n=1 Tax=unclassified Microbulbifer TaxID=2619833 RepID=UPI0027E5339B|nr:MULTISPECIES: metallophosphoesterase [unclassified Microbulbifer]